MILPSVSRALSDLLSPPFRAALWKSLGLTAVVLIALWFTVEAGFAAAILPMAAPYLPDWASGAETLASLLAGLALAIGLAFLIAPVSALIAGLFLDDVAEIVERTHYPANPPGRAMALWPSLVASAKFFGIVILGNLFALMLLLVPGINLAAFFVVNGYLLGREYFEFAALRYRTAEEARAMRRRHRAHVFLAGLIVAGFMAVPILNLLTPLFAAALMVHLHQRASAAEGGLDITKGATSPLPRPLAESRPAVPARRSS